MKSILQDKPKANTTVTLHPDIKAKAKELSLNVSKIAEDAVKKAIFDATGIDMVRMSDLDPSELTRFYQQS